MKEVRHPQRQEAKTQAWRELNEHAQRRKLGEWKRESAKGRIRKPYILGIFFVIGYRVFL